MAIRQNFITFERLQEDYKEIGTIRSVSVNHERGLLVLVCDAPEEERQEASTIRHGVTLDSTYQEVEPDGISK